MGKKQSNPAPPNFNGDPTKVEQILASMGLPATDKITGFKGVLISISFDVFGCIQGCLKPPVSKEGQDEKGGWFDINRLDFEKPKNRKMDCANFEKIYSDFEPPKQEKPLSRSSTAGMGCSDAKPDY